MSFHMLKATRSTSSEPDWQRSGQTAFRWRVLQHHRQQRQHRVDRHRRWVLRYKCGHKDKTGGGCFLVGSHMDLTMSQVITYLQYVYNISILYIYIYTSYTYTCIYTYTFILYIIAEYYTYTHSAEKLNTISFFFRIIGSPWECFFSFSSPRCWRKTCIKLSNHLVKWCRNHHTPNFEMNIQNQHKINMCPS